MYFWVENVYFNLEKRENKINPKISTVFFTVKMFAQVKLVPIKRHFSFDVVHVIYIYCM